MPDPSIVSPADHLFEFLRELLSTLPACLHCDGEFFPVGRILDSQLRDDDELWYLIRWKDRPASEDSWEPAYNIVPGNARMVNAYHRAHPNKPK
ncbi:hypothetical protein CAOG_010250 [Capsaspora owczarzaki ATCC 30864]|uniref:Chromo domain-containing protein n=1 Tax=Capsaspora owczarzaki (strain ATCC 30864) TaxID=595528 RepID=A0A0D2UTX8_CAPO3|nr:hypothetical protein CAOG_010250 [Capsaspora owczarzaki ATCC 30864]